MSTKHQAPAPTPARRRAVVTANNVKKPTLALVQLAARTYTENAAQNKAKAAYEKTRKELFAQMTAEGFKAIDATAQIDGKSVALKAEITTPSVNYIDVAVLAKLVSHEVFLLCVSASQKAVEENAGKGIAASATRTGTGTENVSVKAIK